MFCNCPTDPRRLGPHKYAILDYRASADMDFAQDPLYFQVQALIENSMYLFDFIGL